MRYLLLLVLVGCISCKKSPEPRDNPHPVAIEDVEQLVNIHNDLAWDLLKYELENQPHKNVLISPYSIHSALSMLLNGAGTSTLDEILNSLKCANCVGTSINEQHKKLKQILTTKEGHPTLTVSNSYFYDDKRIQVKDDFKTDLETYFDCVFRIENFDNVDQAKSNINNWVKAQTNGKIDEIVENITSDQIAFLINALHFKADWSKGFDPEWTSEMTFTQSDGKGINIPFLSDLRKIHSYTNGQQFIADIPFKDSTFSLVLIGSSSTIPNDFASRDYNELKNSMGYRSIGISFPKMKLEYKNSMISTLKKLGINSAFDSSRADFSKMGTSRGTVFINDILHKSILEVDERGAEGAAVTSVEFISTEAPPFLTFNNPYILVLRHIPTETILFLGKVNENPL